MGYIRLKYGVEYNPHGTDGNESSGHGCLIVAIIAVAVISIGWSIVAHLYESGKVVEKTAAAQRIESPALPSQEQKKAPPQTTLKNNVQRSNVKVTAAANASNRPVVVRNLLLRLNEAERLNDVEMAATTIERIRALPGEPAADLDDKLARRLGDLNLVRLFEFHNGQWVKPVIVKTGDSAIRIARENGSSYASVIKLNGLNDANKIRVGQKLLVMANPRFILVVHKRSRIADLSLNGRFFRRYDLLSVPKCEEGVYEVTSNTKRFLSSMKFDFSAKDRSELEMLLVEGAQVSVSEM